MSIPPPDIEGFPRVVPGTRGGRGLTIRTVLRLQQSVGNREVVRLLTKPRAPLPQVTDPPVVRAAASASLLPVLLSVPALTWRQRLALAWNRLASRR